MEPPGRIQTRSIVWDAGGVAAEAYLERAAQDAFVTGKPAEAHLRGDAEGSVGDGALGGPQAGGGAAKPRFVEAARAGELLAGVFRMDEGRSNLRRTRIGFLGGARVAHERQDGVVEGRGGDFNLSALCGRGVFGQNAAEQLDLLLPQRGLVLIGEISALRGEGAHHGSWARYSSSIQASWERSWRSRQSRRLMPS